MDKYKSLRLMRRIARHEPPGVLRLLTSALYKGGWADHEGWPTEPVMVRGKQHGYLMKLQLDDPVERITFCLGRYYETDVLMALSRLVRPGDTFIDGGANIGMTTLHAAGLVGPSGRVLSFEPNSAVRERLLEHVEMNRLQNVTVIPCALGQEESTASLALLEHHSGTATLCETDGAVSRIDVRVAPLDAFLGQMPEERPVVMKLDLEGYEWQAIRGMSETFRTRNVRAAIIEKDSAWIERGEGNYPRIREYMEVYQLEPFDLTVTRRAMRRHLALTRPHGAHPSFNAVFVKRTSRTLSG